MGEDAVPLTGDLDAAERDARVAAALRGASDEIERLPVPDRQIAGMAARGTPLWEIAQAVGQSEQAVAGTIERVYAAVSGRSGRVATGGLGSDPSPGEDLSAEGAGLGVVDAET